MSFELIMVALGLILVLVWCWKL